MKNLEIERLKGESDEKDGEISRLEKLVGDGNKVIAGYVQRASWLTFRFILILVTIVALALTITLTSFNRYLLSRKRSTRFTR